MSAVGSRYRGTASEDLIVDTVCARACVRVNTKGRRKNQKINNKFIHNGSQWQRGLRNELSSPDEAL
jgi:hypothetical protein